jgi:hypothetical protein
MARSDESVGACDLFELQDLNVSASGAGDRAIFERNVANAVPGFDRLVVHAKSSADLTQEEVGIPQRIFHVDGGHAVEEALSDIRLGADVLHEGGVIVVDDPFRVEWPGVTEAILQFLDERREFSALVAGFNKIVLLREAARSPYDDALRDPWGYIDGRVYSVKTLPIAGRPTTIFYVPTYRQSPGLEVMMARVRSWEVAARQRLRR